MRNNAIFGDGKCSVKQSAQFIHSYLTSFMQVKYSNSEPDIKGKNLAIEPCIRKAKESKKEPEAWCNPEEGWHKLNVDTSFLKEENKGAWGAIQRDSNGEVIFQLGVQSLGVKMLRSQRPSLCWKG
jgi:hypothetical protein